jgi:hypothetical protein
MQDKPHTAADVTDGTSKSTRYFSCQEGCGSFVPLNMICQVSQKANAPKNSSTYPRGSCTPTGTHDRASLMKSPSIEPAIDFCIMQDREGASVLDKTPFLFELDEQVICLDKYGSNHYGVVRWTGRGCGDMRFSHPVVGIQTVSRIWESTSLGSLHVCSGSE